MKWRRSLSTKILLVSFLNVALLGLVFFVLPGLQFRSKLTSFLLSPVRDRVLAMSRQIALELPTLPRSSWNQLLARYSGSHPADFYLFDSDGQQLAGPATNLPSKVLNVFRNDPFAHLDRRGPPPDGLGPNSVLRPQWGLGPDSGFGPQTGPGRENLVVIESAAPSQNWIVARIPVFMMGAKGPLHGELVLRVHSLWLNLNPFFDLRPWIAVALAVTLVSFLCWLPLIRGLTRSIAQLTRVTVQIADGGFDVQVPARRRDELGQLSESINRMAQRLSGFVHGQKRFLGDIAHELCAPIARIQVALGIIEQRAGENEIEYVVDLKAEVDHMSSLVNELLSFSKAQIKTGINLAEVNVAETVRRVVQREGTNSVELNTDISEKLNIMGQPDYIFRSLANVIRNAIRYAGEAGPITVSARNGDGVITIVVADSGPGVPESELDEIFKPFYRPEFARTRETGGTGLGLAIVKSCIESCGGTVSCRNLSPKGFKVEMRLTAAS